MKFICRKLAEKVDRQLCSECTHYKTCKKDGYLEEVDKGAYTKVKQAASILSSLGVPPNENLNSLLTQADRNYASNKFLWKHKPKYSEIKNLLSKVRMSSEELTSALDDFISMTRVSIGTRIELERLLQTKGIDLAGVLDVVSRLCGAVDELCRQPQRDLPDMPFYFLVRNLKEIFEQATGESATIGLIANKEENVSLNPFLTFVSSFLIAVGDPHAYLKPETLAKRCQRALDPDYIKPLKETASLRALTGIPFKLDTRK